MSERPNSLGSSDDLKLGRIPAESPSVESVLDAKTIGNFGEQLVCEWLKAQRCQILHQQWQCRFGEIDLIAMGQSGEGALRDQMLAFIEVKTRSSGNWDADGLLSVTRSKQKKLRTTARYFLVRHPHLSELPCRFDIALVTCQSQMPNGRHIAIPGHKRYVTMQAYLKDAFV